MAFLSPSPADAVQALLRSKRSQIAMLTIGAQQLPDDVEKASRWYREARRLWCICTDADILLSSGYIRQARDLLDAA